MARKLSKRSRWLLIFSLVSGLIVLAWMWMRSKDPRSVIKRELSNAGFSDRMIAYWIAISQHETAGWTSRVYKEANNLFGMTLASRNTTAIGALPYGEHQAIYKSILDSARDQVLYLTVRFHYPKDFSSLRSLVDYMKAKGYFGDSVSNYYAGVSRWLDKTNQDLT